MMAEEAVKIPQLSRPNGWQKLMSVQSRLTVEKENNGANGRYKYYRTENILDKAKPLLKEVGAAVTMTDEIEEHTGKLFVKCTAKFVDVDTGEIVETVTGIVEHALNPGMNAAQSTGSSSTYARKRALAGLLLVDGEKDPDEIPPEVPRKNPQRQEARQRNTREELRAKLAAEGINAEDFSKIGYNAPFSEMPQQTAAEILQNFSQYLKGYKDLRAKAEEEIPL